MNTKEPFTVKPLDEMVREAREMILALASNTEQVVTAAASQAATMDGREEYRDLSEWIARDLMGFSLALASGDKYRLNCASAYAFGDLVRHIATGKPVEFDPRVAIEMIHAEVMSYMLSGEPIEHPLTKMGADVVRELIN
jgi:hypothetical protein